MLLLFLFFVRSAPAAGAPATEGGAPQQPPNLTSNRRLQQTQAQVDEVSTHSNKETSVFVRGRIPLMLETRYQNQQLTDPRIR